MYLSAKRFSIAWENEIQMCFRFSFFFRAVKMEFKSHFQNPIFNLDESDIRLSFFPKCSSKNVIPPWESHDPASKIVSSSHELLHSSFSFTNISGSIPTRGWKLISLNRPRFRYLETMLFKYVNSWYNVGYVTLTALFSLISYINATLL